MYVGVLIAWSASSSLVSRSTRVHAAGRAISASAKAAVAAVGARPRGEGEGSAEGVSAARGGVAAPLSSFSSSRAAAAGRGGGGGEKKRRVVVPPIRRNEAEFGVCHPPIVGGTRSIETAVDAPPPRSVRSLCSPVRARTESTRPLNAIWARDIGEKQRNGRRRLSEWRSIPPISFDEVFFF